MNEAVQPPADTGASDPGPGALLRRYREAAGLHIAALAVAIKVPVRKLEALEADRWDLLPDAVFVRALASSVCRTLRVDPGEILRKLPQSASPRLDNEARAINTTFESHSPVTLRSGSARVSRPAVLWVLGLLLAALVVVFMPDLKQNHPAEGTSAETATAPEPQGRAVFGSEPVALSAAPSLADPPAAHVQERPPVPVSSAPVAAPALQVRSVPASPTATAPAAAAAPPTSAHAPAPDPSGGATVSFVAHGNSWVEVRDAEHAVLLRRMLAAGEQAQVSGIPPLSVVVGAADATTVQVRGQPFSLEPSTSNNVAKFEVN